MTIGPSSVSGDSSASQQNDDESKLTQEQKELKRKIVEEDEDKFAFNRTLDNFVELKRVKEDGQSSNFRRSHCEIR